MNIIKKLRSQLGLSQVSFAEKVGVSLDTIKSWEIGRRTPTGAYVEMLLLLNEDEDLKSELKMLHPIYSKVEEVLCYIQASGEQEVRFVLFGESGCGKSRVVRELDSLLPHGNGVAENTELVWPKNMCKAWSIITDDELAYADSRHIAFSVLNDKLAHSLELNGIKVFRFD